MQVPLTCSSVSCHGGQTSPDWRAGSLNTATQCGACHAINGGALAAQFNDATGRHAWGTHAQAAAADCTLCHDMSAANHFKYLDTQAPSGAATGTPSDQLPSATLRFRTNDATYPITGAATYSITSGTPQGDGGCALVCHVMTHAPATDHWKAVQGAVAHPVPFTGAGVSQAGNHHQTLTYAQFISDCIACHDEGGTSTKYGPTCTACHTLGSPVSAGKGAGTCLSCHTGAAFTTQGPTGAAWPNLAGSHAKHLALATFTRTSPTLPSGLTASAYPQCEACHVGSVPGDAANTHYSNANKLAATPKSAGPGTVSIQATFNAKSGPAGFVSSASAFTCSNVSCHGGKVTPGWQTGTLTVNANTWCLSCHQVVSTSTQYNDATGRHNNPTAHNQTCDHCHDMNATSNPKTGVVNHFKYLDTTAVSGIGTAFTDQYPSDTIKFGQTGVTTPATGALTYTVTTPGRGGCALTCHSQSHTTTGNVWN